MNHFENLERNASQIAPKNKEEELNKLAEEGKERIIQELKKARDLSGDRFFQQMDIDGLDGEALIGLHKVMNKYKTPFPAEIMADALDFYLTDNKLLRGEEFYDPITPENTDDFLKDQISRYPNVFYSNYYGEKAQNQGTDQPNTRA